MATWVVALSDVLFPNGIQFCQHLRLLAARQEGEAYRTEVVTKLANVACIFTSIGWVRKCLSLRCILFPFAEGNYRPDEVFLCPCLSTKPRRLIMEHQPWSIFQVKLPACAAV